LSDLIQKIEIAVAAGSIAAIACLAEHKARTFSASPVVAYTVGSATCLLPLTAALILLTGNLAIGLVGWIIWGMAGLATTANYKLDHLAANKTINKIISEAKRNEKISS